MSAYYVTTFQSRWVWSSLQELYTMNHSTEKLLLLTLILSARLNQLDGCSLCQTIAWEDGANTRSQHTPPAAQPEWHAKEIALILVLAHD